MSFSLVFKDVIPEQTAEYFVDLEKQKSSGFADSAFNF